jgi:hypothetical protein
MMKHLFAIAIVGITTSSFAETVLFSSFRLELEDGWVYDLERVTQAHNEIGDLIRIYHPGGDGILKIRPISVPGSVSQETLRNMTNVDSSTALNWQGWGDYSGYQYDYSEGGSFFRQWWIANEKTILLIVYDSSTEITAIEIDQINKIVNSITAHTTMTN